jgi:putative hydrolase of the HAD superfamily
MTKKAVIFDLYGTLINIQTDEYDPVVYANLSRFLSYHMVRIKPEDLRKVYNEDIHKSLASSNEPYPEVDVYEIFKGIMQRYGSGKYVKSAIKNVAMLFRALTIRRFQAFEGIYEVLNFLVKDYKLAIVSDAQWVFAEPEMQILGLTRYFKTTVFSSKFGIKKPDIRLFQSAMRRLKVKPEEAIYIGDRPDKDLVGAKKAGMKCLLFSTVEVSLDGMKADRQFADYSELERIIKEITA